MRIRDISPYFTQFYNDLKKYLECDNNLFAAEIENNLSQLNQAYSNPDQAISTLFETHRLLRVCNADLYSNQIFKDELNHYDFPKWNDYKQLNADTALQDSLADKLYNIKSTDQGACLRIGFKSQHVANNLFERILKSRKSFFIDYVDIAFKRLVLNHCAFETIESYGSYDNDLYKNITTRMSITPNSTGDIPFKSTPEKSKLYAQATEESVESVRSGKCHFTLTYFPTEIDAERDQVPYKDYLNLFFEMIDQPWDEIKIAHECLIKKFNTASFARFTNNDGTDIFMSLVEKNGTPFTFANSHIEKNVPGSEIFSAPQRESVNGTIVAKGYFAPRHDETLTIKDLTLVFKDGKIVSFSAEEGAEHFQAFLDRDENNYYVGELGIGTNPHLKTHLINVLLVEKIGGSFHLALGASYTMTDYLGSPVHMNNGNKSKDHWDITTMLHGKEGGIYLDGEKIMENGMFLDPQLRVLNEGWGAIPMNERPKQWQKKVVPFTRPTL